jgi:hypothetical protein
MDISSANYDSIQTDVNFSYISTTATTALQSVANKENNDAA